MIAHVLAAAIVSPGAQGHDLLSDFSVVRGNPNELWSYGASAGSRSTDRLFRQTSGLIWMDSLYSHIHPVLGLVTPTVGRSSGGPVVVRPLPTGYPGVGNYAFVRFRFPDAGVYFVRGQFGAGEPGAVDLEIESTAIGPSMLRRGVSQDVIFDMTFRAERGQNILFLVGASAARPDSHLSGTPLHLTITRSQGKR